MQLPTTLLLLLLAPLLASAQSSSRSASESSHSQSASASPVPSSSGLGTPSGTLSASLPSLSGVPICVTDCMAQATAADGCASFVAVDCFCPNPEPYMAALLACLANATLASQSSSHSSLPLSSASRPSSASAAAPSASSCIDPLPDAASIVNQFCALAAVSTSLSFPASLPPLQSLSFSFSGSHSGSATAPPQQSQSGSQTPNAAGGMRIGGGGGWIGMGGVAVVGAGLLAGAWAVL
ncbi:hypothetical protein R3P38DRAFT_2844453 [Favolaschia claudopus]|uniref:CFEM domain-containing protein n=1 Tax=Favolaschia claudopus TaxID=2862362 RepID=A0AAW0E232_9AGAR